MFSNNAVVISKRGIYGGNKMWGLSSVGPEKPIIFSIFFKIVATGDQLAGLPF